ncbi:hypothetical protein Plim_0890 [Planctopirus limnophila DSM 3776]|uniref:Uncharacterized protein n=1 Tax=Planctopirus limnophila (strain ATCC 43296 / DSM 3776 / IFAM 1008 / Mu 290) TaxID=521674 RepID=D5SSI6_PLAL2|nr:hypothetical protein Plim_0890 [Planctopirus limnophila DSM 3776]
MPAPVCLLLRLASEQVRTQFPQGSFREAVSEKSLYESEISKPLDSD